MNDLTEKSKFLSYVLRHRPASAGLTLDKEGWADIDVLLANSSITLDELLQIVRTDSKGRYSVRPAAPVMPTHVRANQGHSTKEVKLTFKRAVPPPTLYHGTQFSAWSSISTRGLLPRHRHHVHLTADHETAVSVGGRRKDDALILNIDAAAMVADGILFYLSDNGVWLADAVAPRYIHLDQS